MAKPPLETHKKIYPFHANVERRLDWKIELSEKIEYAQILNSMTQAKKIELLGFE